MLDLKRCAIKMASNIKVVDSKRGKVTLKNDLILRGLRNNCEYEELIKEAIMTMKEINKVEFFYEKLNLIISIIDFIQITTFFSEVTVQS